MIVMSALTVACSDTPVTPDQDTHVVQGDTIPVVDTGRAFAVLRSFTVVLTGEID